MSKLRPGVVSVILVNFRGADDTLEAIRHLRDLDWPAERLEIVVVENASGDDSLEKLRAGAPGVTLIESAKNLGFAGGCNLGVARSHGEYVAFLNNDARPDAQWVSAAVRAFESGARVGAVASRVLDWEGENVDYMGSALTWFGMGYKPFTGEPIPKIADPSRDVLFGTGSAMFVRRDVYDILGGFDESYFMFFEDVDLGWRLNLLGWRFRYEPASLAYHKHHASMSSYGSHKERYLLERNALATLYKNLDDATLAQALPAAMALSVRRGITLGKEDSTAFDLRKGGSDEPTTTIAAEAVAPLFAIDQFTEMLPGLSRSREVVQSTRTVSDGVVWKLFGNADVSVLHDAPFLRGYENLVDSFDVSDRPTTARVVVVTGDPIGPRLAGPAIRAWNMAELLSRENDVTLVTLAGLTPVESPFEIVHINPGDDYRFGPLADAADVIVFQGHAMAVFDSLRESDAIMVVDIYDPMHLEQLEQGRELAPAVWAKQVADATDVLNEQLERGDFFLCASERQRHFYLGQLAGLGRINPTTYRGDPDLRGLLDVAPFGLSDTPPRHERDVMKGVRDGIGPDDKLLLWSGGLYNWFDPLTLIRAVAALAERRPSVKLFFQGTKHPHPHVPEMAIVAQSRELARELGVLDRNVFFNDTWVEFADRQNFLTEADAGVSTHHAHIETTYSFRTRILDYLWAELPMVVTEGDHFAELIEHEGLGVVVPAEDVVALTDGLEKVLFDDEFAAAARERVRVVRERYTWETVLAPLVDFVRDPHPAADRIQAGAVKGGSKGSPKGAQKKPSKRRRRSGPMHDMRMFFFHMRHSGPRVVFHKVGRRLGLRR